ncbi:MAG: NAD(P)/FAD-dependent oxidoreductase [Planctomycetes bacterium]|nr:NAD(P)/FAD-dependent oxidoreductase [Planctomycetota bacterium]
MHYDAVIIGAGMSGLAAGIRLAYFDKRVCILEKHYAYGGLNSYYTLEGREFDVGLHAVTNYAPAQRRAAPFNRLLRQLRLSREELDLRPQRFSEITFPGTRLRFTNDITVLTEQIAAAFPAESEGFRRLLAAVGEFDDTRLDAPYVSARRVLGEYLRDPRLIDMLLLPLMYYGSAEERDMDFTQFVILFKSILCEGFARPRGGVRTVLKALVRKYRGCGGALRMRCGVERLLVQGSRVSEIVLSSGEVLTADAVLSSAGYWETMRLCTSHGKPPPPDEVGRVSFVEVIAVLDELPARLGHEATITFFNEAETFTYARPDEPVDFRSGVICCPSNYEGHEDMPEGLFRVTWLANAEAWMSGDDAAYRARKAALREPFLRFAERCMPGAGAHVVYVDIFTPRTIQRYTGHINGAVYGAPRKRRDGRTPLSNLFICGTDQGYLGIVGAMISGVTIANLHVLDGL